MADEADKAHQPAPGPTNTARPVAARVTLASNGSPQGERGAPGGWEDPLEEQTIPLTRADAERLFGPDVSRPSRVTPMRVVAGQVVLTFFAALICALLSQQWRLAALSALIGGMICWVPSGGFALYLGRNSRGRKGRDSVGAWMMAEGIKLGVTIALFIAIAVYFRDVRWLPLLVTYVLALKVYWLALAWR
ncbi:ATP synthase subunit I [Robbsia sp. Bb-Pol-6]|uniref:ATP synthase subunit I n=1 Tax=Robbsia betulipollinis TaxID=2981849 RepID=A0ABT3ZTB0_9BURK|nr:ATP synthase subunit I [Robbsia betulipollinis]MCY0389165.1 ATP synthase subunit I [Robbsia betulipollinis]